ncbi:VOC family protein [Aerococcaceae bacterium 50-4]
MVQVVPYLNFAHSKEVLSFYEKLGAKVTGMVLANDAMFADMPEDERPKNPNEFVMNASIEVLGNQIFLSDTWGNKEVDHGGSNLSFVFDQHDENEVAQVKSFFKNAIDLGCEETMPLSPSEWSELFGMFKDPYGISWMFSGE